MKKMIMKRTTYIMIGMLVAGLVIIAGFVFYMSAHTNNARNNTLNITGETKTVKLAECKVIQISAMKSEVKVIKNGVSQIEGRSVSFAEVPLLIQPADSLAQGSLSFAGDMEPFVTMSTNEDTLHIAFDFPREKLEERFKDKRWLEVRSAEMVLKIPTKVQSVACNINDMTTLFKGFRSDTFSFDAAGTIVVEDCHFSTLHAKGWTLKLKSGEVRDLYLDLDAVWNWETTPESFHIGTEHLSGSNNHNYYVAKGECRQILWTPKSGKAVLNLSLNQAAKVEANQ